jgi:hypothetical protein
MSWHNTLFPLVLLFIISGCLSSTTPSTPHTLVGTWTSYEYIDLTSSLQDCSVTVTFHADGNYEMAVRCNGFSDKTDITVGSFSVDKNEIRFTNSFERFSMEFKISDGRLFLEDRSSGLKISCIRK